MSDTPLIPARLPRRPLLLAAALIAAELLIVGITFKHGIRFDCRANWGGTACGLASRSLAALYCLLAAGGLFAVLRAGLVRRLLAEARQAPRALWLNLPGFALALTPVALLQEGQGAAMRVPAFALWGGGMALMLAGLALWLAPPARWRGGRGARAAAAALPLHHA